MRTCFADEIAIDFPSIAPAVDRVRETFVSSDDRAVPLETEVALTPRQAWIGAIVPIALDLSGLCAGCGGRGETWAEPCAHCAGTGERGHTHHFRLALPRRRGRRRPLPLRRRAALRPRRPASKSPSRWPEAVAQPRCGAGSSRTSSSSHESSTLERVQRASSGSPFWRSAVGAASLAVTASAEHPGTEVAAGITAATLAVVAVTALAWAAVHCLCARGLSDHRAWARALAPGARVVQSAARAARHGARRLRAVGAAAGGHAAAVRRRAALSSIGAAEAAPTYSLTDRWTMTHGLTDPPTYLGSSTVPIAVHGPHRATPERSSTCHERAVPLDHRVRVVAARRREAALNADRQASGGRACADRRGCHASRRARDLVAGGT